MPVFATPEPILADIELSVGDVQIIASDRTDTVVEVRPTDESDESDVDAARNTRVEYANGTVTVRGPKGRMLSRKTRSVDVVVELPTGSRVTADLSVADLRGVGVLGECRLTVSVGHVRLDRTGPLRLSTTAGHIAVDAVAGDADVATGSGRLQLGTVDGAAVVKNSNGDTTIDTVAGELRVRSANGDITVERAAGKVEARTANGTIRVGEVSRESAALTTAAGDVEIGIAEGSAAWLDLKTGHGRVRNSLAGLSAGPGESQQTVEVRAHTSYGDITVRRS